MKGLLHRLAARAAGTAVPVRSDVRLAFGGGDFADGEGIETAPMRQPSLIAPAVVELRAERPIEPPREASPALIVEGSVPHPIAMQPASVPAPARTREPVQHSSDAERVADESPPPPLMPASPIGRQGVERREAPAAIAEPAPPEAPSDRAASHNVQGPEPLMPMVARDRAVVSPSAPATTLRIGTRPPSAVAPEAADEPTEVHIHIGRIDVTAVHDAPSAPRKRAAATPDPMSLDAYLARRSRS